MDYEKRYKETLEKAKECMKDGGISQNTIDYLCDIFPELTESEDERIRKSILEHIQLCTESIPDRDKFISWLEKQGELKSSKWVEGDVVRHGGILALVTNGRKAMKSNYEQITIQYPDEWKKADSKERKHFFEELEKQSEIDKISYEIAENEKRGFVGDGFIQCYVDFQDFKEGETYWLEYLGNDDYNVRSDNLLGKTYHITPYQLYTIFMKQTWLKRQGEKIDNTNNVDTKFNEDDWIVGANNICKITSLNNELNCYIALTINNEEIKIPYYFDDGPGHMCSYHLWTIADAIDGDVLYSKKHNLIWIYKDNKHYYASINLNYADVVSFDNEIVIPSDVCPANRMKRSILFQKIIENGHEWDNEKKEIKKVITEPKFHEGDWAVSNLDRKARQISEVHFDEYNSYYVVDGKSVNLEEYDRLHHLWTIQDAKDGDVLCYETKDELKIFIYKNGHVHYHCCYCNGHLTTIDSFFVVEKYLLCYIHPATKEQCSTLFSKMKEAGLEWDGEKKELKNIKTKEGEK